MASKITFDDGGPAKRARFSTPEFPDELVLKTAISMGVLSDLNVPCYTLTPLEIINCNGADCQQGFTFPDAYCSVSPIEPLHVFGSVFEKGIYMVLHYLDGHVLPDNNQEKHILCKLLDYLVDKDSHAVLEQSEMFSETDVSVLLANHLFVKLAASPSYTIDWHSKGRRGAECPCCISDCKLSGQYGDTSAGNEEVWHGSLDIIINDDVIVVKPLENTDGNSLEERKPASLKNNPQIIAETIVFSFLQKQRHSEDDHYLFPCIGVTGKDLVFFFYDSDNDVLLESSPIPLLVEDSGGEFRINFVAVLASWLVINYKYLCSGLTESMLSTDKKAGFFSHAGSMLDIYEYSLKLGNVGEPSRSRKHCNVVDASDPILKGSREIIDKIKAKQSGHIIL
ncbi:uncharacterized protein LOC117333606 [Pecten maximus]|uniref:uncharacterized protein LOC117333606 n=1 Tax=Pecten maximus TaxID=6579 RepID=UPI001458E0B1|nr:uncharacterized protein LOC117333606 [Pecten maximus]